MIVSYGLPFHCDLKRFRCKQQLSNNFPTEAFLLQFDRQKSTLLVAKETLELNNV